MKLILNRLNTNYNNANSIIHSNLLQRAKANKYYSTLTSFQPCINTQYNQAQYFTKQTKILRNTVLLEFANHKALCNSFIRIQEFYENSDYYLQKINLTDLQLNEYYSNWLGFNLPFSIVKKFKLIYSIEELTSFEKNLLNLVNKIEFGDSQRDCYLIATSSSNPHLRETLKHETCHALYYLDNQFKTEADKLLDTIPKAQMNQLNKLMKSLDYHESVWKDEIQAYLISESYKSPFLLSRGIPVYLPFWQELIAKLNLVFENGVNRNKI